MYQKRERGKSNTKGEGPRMGSGQKQKGMRKGCRKGLKSVGGACIPARMEVSVAIRASIQDDLTYVSRYLQAVTGAVKVADEIEDMVRGSNRK